ncbi:MAG: 3-deoxy-manno-octulosonate cytidylyltransferase [Candidatus Delongbacteria bacterium]|nr:3-deoxy-manno-octulosonate cytidylyltransferase [Candidatus Delongbacteria bacterium]
MTIYGVIPARFESTRFPGKILHLIHGKPLLEHVIERVKQARSLHRIIVATDHKDIFNLAVSLHVSAVMTPSTIASGTDRIAFILPDLESMDGAVNIQGDEPLIEPDLIDQIAAQLSSYPIVTAVTPCSDESAFRDPNVVKVVSNQNDEALYFSRSPIPFHRDHPFTGFWRHIGIYGYTRDSLIRFTGLPISPLERDEKLEQLRFLDNGFPIRLIRTDYQGWGIDTPDDVTRLSHHLLPIT